MTTLILAFSDDSSVQVFDSVEQANRSLESIDVENGEYVFVDSEGNELTPAFGPPVKRKILGLIPTTFSGPFTLQPTSRRRNDLLQKLSAGPVRISRGESSIKSIEQLRTHAPALFITAEDGDDAFRAVVLQRFGEIAAECGALLKQIEPLIFGFCTEHAVLSIGAYPGHFRGICVKLRQRSGSEDASVRDDVDVGLANFEGFVRPDQPSGIYTRRQRWAADEIRNEVESLATVTREVAMPFLIGRNVDWAGVRQFVDEKIERAKRERSRQSGI